MANNPANGIIRTPNQKDAKATGAVPGLGLWSDSVQSRNTQRVSRRQGTHESAMRSRRDLARPRCPKQIRANARSPTYAREPDHQDTCFLQIGGPPCVCAPAALDYPLIWLNLPEIGQTRPREPDIADTTKKHVSCKLEEHLVFVFRRLLVTPEFGQTCPMSAKLGPDSAESGRIWPGFGEHRIAFREIAQPSFKDARSATQRMMWHTVCPLNKVGTPGQ